MKRMLRRTAVVALGLLLGWYAAGFLPGSLSSDGLTTPSTALAQESHATEAAAEETGKPAESAAAEKTSVPHDDHPKVSGGAPEKHTKTPGASGGVHAEGAEHHDQGMQVAALVSPQHETIGWFRCVLITVVALFAGAIVLGVPSAWFRGPLPPDPAESHDAHSGGGHDDHGHGGHDAHGHDAHGHGTDAHPGGGHSGHDAHAKPGH